MAIHKLEATYQKDPDANISRLEAKYLTSAHLYDDAIRVSATPTTATCRCYVARWWTIVP